MPELPASPDEMERLRLKDTYKNEVFTKTYGREELTEDNSPLRNFIKR